METLGRNMFGKVDAAVILRSIVGVHLGSVNKLIDWEKFKPVPIRAGYTSSLLSSYDAIEQLLRAKGLIIGAAMSDNPERPNQFTFAMLTDLCFKF